MNLPQSVPPQKRIDCVSSSTAARLGLGPRQQLYPSLLRPSTHAVQDLCGVRTLCDRHGAGIASRGHKSALELLPVSKSYLELQGMESTSNGYEDTWESSAPTTSMRIAKTCFEQAADRRGPDVGGLVQLRNAISQALRVPEEAFGSMQRQLLRFDSDGSGRLDEHELYILMKMNLREYRNKCASGSQRRVTIPRLSLKSAGYDVVRQVGHGNQSTAFLANDRVGRARCVKYFEKSKMQAADIEAVAEEYELLNSISVHPNIATISDIFQDDAFYYTVQTLHEGGDFTTLKKKAKKANVQLTESWWRIVFKQCFQGLEHLHHNGLMHCDIKEPNLMLKKDKYHRPEIVIIDFGLMQTAAADNKMVCGTPGYIPPEVWEEGIRYPSDDVFAMGVVVMQLLLDRVPPHHSPPPCEVLPGGIFTEGAATLREAADVARTREPPFELMPSDLIGLTKLARKMLDKSAASRPRAAQVLRDDWFECADGRMSCKHYHTIGNRPQELSNEA